MLIKIKTPLDYPVYISLLTLMMMIICCASLFSTSETVNFVGLTGILLYLSVFGHELAHATAAKILGGKVILVSMFVWSGVAVIEIGKSPKKEFLVSIAGPLSNVVFVLIFIGLSKVTTNQNIASAFQLSAIFSWLLIVFNMLPISMLDGGRCFKSCCTWLLGEQVGLTASMYFSYLLCFLIIACACVNQNFNLVWIFTGMYLLVCTKRDILSMTQVPRNVSFDDTCKCIGKKEN